MKCPICGKDVELQKKQVGVDEQGAPIFHQYAVCRDCKKQWDLDKQRARKAVPDTAAGTERTESSAAKPVSDGRQVRRKPSSSKTPSRKTGEESPAVPKESGQASSANPPSEKKAPRKAPEGAPVGKNVRKPVKEDISPEGKAAHKVVSNEASANKKIPRKSGEGQAPSGAKGARKPASEEASVEKKNARRPAAEKPTSEKVSAPRPGAKKRPSGGPAPENASAQRHTPEKAAVKRRLPREGVRPEGGALPDDASKKKAVRGNMSASEEQRYGNIPPEKIRVKKEHAVRQGYEDMLSTDPNYKPPKKKKALPEDNVRPMKKEHPAAVKEHPHTRAELEDEYDEHDDEEMEFEENDARFRILRIIFGIISIVAAGFFACGGSLKGLNNITAGGTFSAGTTFIVFAVCMLVSGLMLLIMQNRNTILAFILPMILYFGGAVFAFLNHQDDPMLLYCAIGGAVFGIIFLVLGIISRNSDGYDGSEDYDDPFEDEHE